MVGILLVAFAVTTRAVVWIEIAFVIKCQPGPFRHHPCGGVD